MSTEKCMAFCLWYDHPGLGRDSTGCWDSGSHPRRNDRFIWTRRLIESTRKRI